MPHNFLERILFLRHADWRQKKQRKLMFWVVLVTALLAAVMGALMLYINSKSN